MIKNLELDTTEFRAQARRFTMLRGRLRARPQDPSSRKLHQHGGFSLVEVLVPWIELEPR